jgi:hypothetical protein
MGLFPLSNIFLLNKKLDAGRNEYGMTKKLPTALLLFLRVQCNAGCKKESH